MRRTWCVVVVVWLAYACSSQGVAASGPVPSRGSIEFADAQSRNHFEEYLAFVDANPTRLAAERETIDRLARSDIQFEIAVIGSLGRSVEGKMTTDGARVILSICNAGGPGAEVASLNSRFAHELEHARQFDAGELALACDPTTGVWASHYASYDIGDEVKAWSAQLATSASSDFWVTREGVERPTLLRMFSDAKSDAERARVLFQHGYSKVNPTMNSNLRLNRGAGHSVGDVIRPNLERGETIFGRVWAVEPDAVAVALGPAGRSSS